MDTRMRRALAKILILVPLGVLSAFLATGPGGLVSYSPATRVGVHSLLAFWISIPASLILLAYIRRPSRSNILLLSALTFSIVIHIGSAAVNLTILNQDVVERLLVHTIADLVDLALFAFILVSASICFLRQDINKPTSRVKKEYLPIVFLTPLIIYSVFWFIILPNVSVSVLLTISWFLAYFAIICFIITIFLIHRVKSKDLPIDHGYLTSSLILFIISIIALQLTLPNYQVGWEFAETIQMGSFLLFCLALGVPYLRRNGYSRRGAYSFGIGLIVIAYFPFLVTIGIEALGLNTILAYQNILAYSIIHLGAGSLSGLMAVLLYIYPKKEPSWNRYPLVLIFALWAAVALVSIFTLAIPATPLLGEPITPYTVGSILTLILLGFTIKWTLNPPNDEVKVPNIFQLSLIWAFIAMLIVTGEVVNQLTLNYYPILTESPIGIIIIEVSNLIIMFAFAFLIFLFAARSRGSPSIELYTVIFLAMWILPNILKSFYSIWYTGWWVSEIYLFIGVLAGTPLLAWLYVKSTDEVAESHARATMYADLLMHDITNFNQMMMTTFELLGSEDISDEQRKKLSDDGCNVISLAEQLISNVRLLSETDRLSTLNLDVVNLVSIIVQALNLFGQRVSKSELVIEFDPKEPDIPILANDLLVHVFLNIFYTILETHQKERSVSVNIISVSYNGEDYWKTEIITFHELHNKKRMLSSGILGITTARTIIESLNGVLHISETHEDDIWIKKTYSILLPAVN